MIKVYYTGFGCITSLDNLSILNESPTKQRAFVHANIKEHKGMFLLSNDIELDIEHTRQAEVQYLISEQNENEALIICDNSTNSYKSPFTKIWIDTLKGDLHGHTGGNRIKLLKETATMQTNKSEERPAPPDTEKPLTENEREKLLSVIGVILSTLKKNNISQSLLLEWIESSGTKIYGTGKSTLNELFSDANKLLSEKLKD